MRAHRIKPQNKAPGKTAQREAEGQAGYNKNPSRDCLASRFTLAAEPHIHHGSKQEQDNHQEENPGERDVYHPKPGWGTVNLRIGRKKNPRPRRDQLEAGKSSISDRQIREQTERTKTNQAPNYRHEMTLNASHSFLPFKERLQYF